METFAIQVTYRTKPGSREAFVKAVEESGTARKVREEQGCICYDYFYSAQDEDTVLLLEEWESEQHQQEHLTQPHMEELRKIKESYVEDTQIKKFVCK